jgi:peptidyl-prolyl cis-trans isomerase C
MARDLKVTLLALLALALVVSGCHSKKEGTTLAKFDSETISKEEFVEKLRSLPREIQSVAYRRKKDFVEEMVNERFLAQEAERRHIKDLPDVKALLEAAHQKIIVAKLIEIEVDRNIKMDPDEPSKYYESHKEEFMAPLLLRASHILMSTQEEANSVKSQIDMGADFETLARSRSTDNTATHGGDIGYFQKGQLIPEFEEQAFKLKKGEISPVFKSQFGYHILKLTDRVEPALKDFKIVKIQLERRLLNEKRSRLLKAFLEKIKGNAKVEIDEKVLESIAGPSSAKFS